MPPLVEMYRWQADTMKYKSQLCSPDAPWRRLLARYRPQIAKTVRYKAGWHWTREDQRPFIRCSCRSGCVLLALLVYMNLSWLVVHSCRKVSL
jgi:hypothetical protein